METAPPLRRLYWLDALRGWSVLSMVLFHASYDLVYIYGLNIPGFTGLPGVLWERSICWVFIAVAGFSSALSHKLLKRGALLFGTGAIIMIVTAVVDIGGTIRFGILTLIGSCYLIMAFARRALQKVRPVLGAAVSFLLFIALYRVPRGNFGFEWMPAMPVPRALYVDNFTAYLGFPGPGFSSADYFPLFPWSLLFFTGFYLCLLWKEHTKGRPAGEDPCERLRVLPFLGRHAFLIYCLHQPLLMAVFTLLFAVIR